MNDSREWGRTVYFLGAGASKSICPWLPVASELTLGKLADRQAYPFETPPGQAVSELATFLDKWAEGEKHRDVPLEESLHVLRTADPYQYGLVHHCLGMRLAVGAYEHRPYSGIETWLNFVRDRHDVIVTTNYDTLIECAHANMPPGELRDSLHCLDFGVYKQRKHEFSRANSWPGARIASVPLLKLHGSISWLYCDRCGTYMLDPVWNRALDAVARPGAYSPCPVCKRQGTRRPVLVPPVRQKELTDCAIKEIWQAAGQALCEAEEIVFAGFSLNKNDAAARELLRMAFQVGRTRRVTVVDRNWKPLEENYRAIYGGAVESAAQADWRAFLDESFSPAEQNKKGRPPVADGPSTF